MKPRPSLWILLGMSACAPSAFRTDLDDQGAAIAVLQEQNTQLRSELVAQGESVAALQATLTARLNALEAHERLVAAEVIADGLASDGVSDDVEGLGAQLAVSRLDALDDGASSSCADICVTDAELAQTLVDYATDADVALLATRAEVAAADAAERDWVLDQRYLTSVDLSGYATLGWVADQGFATVAYVNAGDAVERQWVEDQGYATDPDLAALAGRVSAIEGDYLQGADLVSYATQTWVVANYPEQAEVDALVADLAGAHLTLDDHEARLSALEADPITATAVAAAADAVTAWVTSQGYATEDALLDEAATRVADAEAIRSDLGEKQDLVRSNLTLQVTHEGPWDGETTFRDVASALTWLNPRAIAPGVTVTIQVGPGIYTGQPTMDVSHPNGDRIQIVGDILNPSEVVMEFSDSALQVRDGAHLGGIDGFVLRWVTDDAAQSVAASNEQGIHAYRGGTATVGASVTVQGFFDCLRAEDGSIIRTGAMACFGNVHAGLAAEGSSSIMAPGLHVVGGERAMLVQEHSYGRAEGLIATGITYTGIEASVGATIFAHSASVEGPRTGVASNHGSYIYLDYSTLANTTHHGLVADVHSAVGAADTDVSGTNADGGVLAGRGSFINFESGTSTGSSSYGVFAYDDSMIYGYGATVTSNTEGDLRVLRDSSIAMMNSPAPYVIDNTTAVAASTPGQVFE